jgi:hypothetical protein
MRNQEFTHNNLKIFYKFIKNVTGLDRGGMKV